jgi:hypothetical protein
MSSTLCRDPVCSCPITDYRGLRLDANKLWLHFLKKTSVAAINITLGVPGQRADKTKWGEKSTMIADLAKPRGSLLFF